MRLKVEGHFYVPEGVSLGEAIFRLGRCFRQLADATFHGETDWEGHIEWARDAEYVESTLKPPA